MEQPALIAIPEVARRLNLSRSKTWALVQAGELPIIRIGRSVRVPVDALEKWIKDRTQEGAVA